jgi:hypothetical protein
MLILILISLLSAAVCFFVAKYRHTDIVFWVSMGFLFGPVAIPFVFFSRPKT